MFAVGLRCVTTHECVDCSCDVLALSASFAVRKHFQVIIKDVNSAAPDYPTPNYPTNYPKLYTIDANSPMAFKPPKSRVAFFAASVSDNQAAAPHEKCLFCWGMLDDPDPAARCIGPPIRLACCKNTYGLDCFEKATASTKMCPCCRRRMWTGDLRERLRDAWLEVTGPRWPSFLLWRYMILFVTMSCSFVDFRLSVSLSDTVEDGLSNLMSELPIARLPSSGKLIIFLGLAMATFQY